VSHHATKTNWDNLKIVRETHSLDEQRGWAEGTGKEEAKENISSSRRFLDNDPSPISEVFGGLSTS
jgi:hypothetical protein